MVQPLFWTFRASYLGGAAAANGIAPANALGPLDGFVAPNVEVWADSMFGSRAGLHFVTATTLAGPLAILLFFPPVPVQAAPGS